MILETLFEKLHEFESTGIDFYSDSNPKKRVVTHPSGEPEKTVDSIANDMGNPYKLIQDWINVEIYDLIGLKESIESVQQIDKKIADAKTEANKLKQSQVDLQNDKISLTTLWRAVTGRKMNLDECAQRIIRLE